MVSGLLLIDWYVSSEWLTAMVSNLCLPYCCIQSLVNWLLCIQPVVDHHGILSTLLLYPVSGWLTAMYPACGWPPWYPISVYLTAVTSVWLVDCYVSCLWLTAMVSDLCLPYCCIQCLVGRLQEFLWVDCHGIQSLSTLLLYPVSGWLTAMYPACGWLPC